MAPALVKECKERLYIDLVQIYGMTEMGPVVAFLVEEDQLRKLVQQARHALAMKFVL